MIYSPADKTVGHVKEAYYAVQNLFALVDSTVSPASGLTVSENHYKSVFKYGLDRGGLPMVVLWEDGDTPTNTVAMTAVDVTVGATFEHPLYVDLRTGEISGIDDADWSVSDGSTYFQRIPVYDSPVLIAEAAAVHSMDREARARNWQWQRFGDPDASEADWSADRDEDGKNNLFEAETGGDPARIDGALPAVFKAAGDSSVEFVLNDIRISPILLRRSFNLSSWDTITSYDSVADAWTGDASVVEERIDGERRVSVNDADAVGESRVFYKLNFLTDSLP